jgi:hypothetical protein
MNCPRCQHENPRASRFCGACGSSLMQSVMCSRCGHANPAGQAFCNGCGQGLGEAAAPSTRDPRTHTPQHLAAKILQSKAALEGALAIGRDRQAGRRNEAMILPLLAEAHLAAGDPRAARETAERALTLARERGMRMAECAAQLAVGRTLLRSEGVRAQEAIDSALAEASSLVSETGAARYAPFIHLERAELARRVGEDTTRQRELSEAHRLFAEMGATARAERVAQELPATVSATPQIPSTNRS